MIQVEIIKPNVDEVENKRRIDEINDFISLIAFGREQANLSAESIATKLKKAQ